MPKMPETQAVCPSSGVAPARAPPKLRQLGYLETGIDAAVATGYDPLRDDEPELARTMAASVKQRIAFGERAGQNVRRIGSGFGYEGERPELTGPRCASVNGFSLHANTQVPAHRRDQLERLIRYTARGAVSLERLEEDANGDLVYTFTKPWSDGTTGITLSPLELLEKLAAIVPLPRVHLVRYAGCLAPHSTLREAIIPTPRQQGIDGEEAKTGTPSWSWARLLGRVFALDMATCPFCRCGSLRIIAAITQDAVITRILRHLQAGLRPTPHRTCPLSPRNIRLGRLSPRRHTWSRRRRARSGGMSHPSERLKSRLKSLPPAFHNRPSRGRRPRAPLRRYPTPSCGACPAPAKATQRRAPPGAGALRRGGRRRGRWEAPGGALPRTQKVLWNSYPPGETHHFYGSPTIQPLEAEDLQRARSSNGSNDRQLIL